VFPDVLEEKFRRHSRRRISGNQDIAVAGNLANPCSKFHAKIAVANSIYDTSLQGFPEPLVGYGFDSIIQPSTPPINITIKSIISKMAFPACQYSLPIRPVGKLVAS